MRNSEQKLNWLNKEVIKDRLELDREKLDLIKNIKQLKKENILPKKPEKLTLWNRIKKVLMG
jgi:hypothetical protein